MKSRVRLPHRALLAGVVSLAVLLIAAGYAAAARGRLPSAPPASTLWGSNFRANSDTSGWGQHEPHLAISRAHPNVVVAVAKDYRHLNNKEVWIYVSQDGGRTWPLDKQIHMPGLPADIPNQSDPVVMARDDGRLYAFCLGYNNGHGLFVTWSDDNGDTWRSPSVHITYNETPYGLDDKEWPVIDNSPTSPYYHNMYIAWANGGILFKRSTDGGEIWSSYQNLTPGDDTEYPYPIVDSDGNLYVFYMNGWGYCADGQIEYVKSTDGGVTFTGPYTVVATSQPCSPIHGPSGYDQWRFFSIITAAVAPNNPDNLWVAWTDDNGVTDGKTDVLYVASTDGGANWGAPARLSHDDPAAYVDHITPVFSIGADSRLHAFWLDRRADPQNHLFHAYHTSTIDGGQTWEPDNRVSEQSFDLNIGFPPGSNNAAGDYWGLDTVGDVVMAAWNTTIYGEQDIFVARGYLTQPVTVTGQVRDDLTLTPITGAQVTVDNGEWAFTNPAGMYSITLPAGVYTFTALADSYISQTITQVALVTGTVNLDFDLHYRLSQVTGQVVDSVTLLPIDGAQVSADTGEWAFTDASGIYTLILPVGVYTITAEASGYFSETMVDFPVITSTTSLDFSLDPLPLSVTLRGQAADRITLALLAGAEVGVNTGQSILTTGDGVYTLTLEAGVYTVTAQANGYFSQTVANVALVSDTVTLDFLLDPLVCPAPEILAVDIVTDDLTASFTATVSSTLPVAYLWAFGDGITSTLPAPTHTYAAYGAYPVTLTVTNACNVAQWSGSVGLIAPPRKIYLPVVLK
jgi:PKD repeat protein